MSASYHITPNTKLVTSAVTIYTPNIVSISGALCLLISNRIPAPGAPCLLISQTMVMNLEKSKHLSQRKIMVLIAYVNINMFICGYLVGLQ